jgi:pimeloyl-ACP methyl ester carboxylesterase
MEEQLTFVNSRGLRLQGLLTMPESGHCLPLVISCHGFSSSKNSRTNTLLAPSLKEAGIACLRFDFTGHGDSEGDIGEITISRGVEDLKSVMSSVLTMTSIDPDRIGLFGSSFGGNVALWYVSLYGKARAIALKAPASDFASVLEKQAGPDGIWEWQRQEPLQAGGLADPTGEGFRSDYALYEDSKRFDTYELVKEIGCSVFITHGDHDEVVPMYQSILLARAIGGRARLEAIAGAGHTFENEGELERVISRSVQFLQQQLAAPRS